MKKLSKFAAVVAAMALLMAMSTSAFAAGENPSPSGNPLVGTLGESVTMNVGDEDITGEIIGKPTLAEIDMDSVADAIADRHVVLPDGVNIEDIANIDLSEMTVVSAAELIFTTDGGETSISLGDTDEVTLTLNVSGMDLPEEVNTIYVLHDMGDGTWEIIPCDIEDNQITFTLHGLSPVYLAYLEQMADQGGDDQGTGDPANNANNTTADKANKKVSPKTGF